MVSKVLRIPPNFHPCIFCVVTLTHFVDFLSSQFFLSESRTNRIMMNLIFIAVLCAQ